MDIAAGSIRYYEALVSHFELHADPYHGHTPDLETSQSKPHVNRHFGNPASD